MVSCVKELRVCTSDSGFGSGDFFFLRLVSASALSFPRIGLSSMDGSSRFTVDHDAATMAVGIGRYLAIMDQIGPPPLFIR